VGKADSAVCLLAHRAPEGWGARIGHDFAHGGHTRNPAWRIVPAASPPWAPASIRRNPAPKGAPLCVRHRTDDPSSAARDFLL